jgi:hypothetical protein
MNAIKQFLEAYWFATLAGAWVVWRVWHRQRLRSTPALEIKRDDAPKLRTKAPFSRADFAAKAEISRREMAKGVFIGMGILIAVPPALAAISWLVPTMPRGFFRIVMTISCVVAVAALFVFALRGSRQTRRTGLVCPACGMELVGPGGTRMHPFSLQDRVLETGKCPGCNTQLLDEAEVQPSNEPMTRAEYAIIAVLVVLLIATVYFARASISANRLARCHDRYARAHSASDSVVVDSTPATRGERVTCGELLGSNSLVR